MTFRLDVAIPVLGEAMAALVEEWKGLDAASRREVIRVIQTHGPQIARASASGVAVRAAGALQALWELRLSLPPGVVGVLVRGRGGQPRPATPITEAARTELLRGIARVHDFRTFRDAESLAKSLSALVSVHQERLTEGDRRSWTVLDAAYRANRDAGSYLAAVEMLLGGYPPIGKALQAGKSWLTPEVTRASNAPAPVAASSPTASGLERALSRDLEVAREVQPAESRKAVQAERDPSLGRGGEGHALLPRYANVHFPSVVLLSQHAVPLVIHVSRQYHERESVLQAEAARTTLRVGELTVVVHPAGFDVVGSLGGQPVSGLVAGRTIGVTVERDCEPVIFFLSPRSTGSKRIAVDLYQTGRCVSSLSFDTEVMEQLAGAQLGLVAIEPVPVPVALRSAGRSPDLQLRVTLSADRRTLSYILHSPGRDDYNFQPAGEVHLVGEPQDMVARVTERLSGFARTPVGHRDHVSSAVIVQELRDIGSNLFNDLFPRQLKEEYSRIRERFVGASLLITSDEPWIPWEMVRPMAYDSKGSLLYDDPCLCETFQMGRWLAGRGAPELLQMKRAAVVVPPGDLSAVREEAAYFARLRRQEWSIEVPAPLTSTRSVEREFTAGETQLFHFACHGNFDARNPDEAQLKLVDGYLRPSQLTGDKQGGLRRARPLVFLNACQSGQTGFAATRLGGWAQRFLDSGASAFVGTLWEVTDELAARFAVEFYDRLWGLSGQQAQPLGAAFHAARTVIKQLDPANPTWLAYVLYGDPCAVMTLGNGS